MEVVLKKREDKSRRQEGRQLTQEQLKTRQKSNLVMLPQRLSVGHSEQGDAHLREEETCVTLC